MTQARAKGAVMRHKQSDFKWIKTALVLSVIVLSACAGHGAGSLKTDEHSANEAKQSLERVRVSDVVAWQMMAPGRLLVELNNPRRSYILALVPSCVFEFKDATGFVFAGKSTHFISVDDDVVVGNGRCRIVAIYETDAKRQTQISGARRMD